MYKLNKKIVIVSVITFIISIGIVVAIINVLVGFSDAINTDERVSKDDVYELVLSNQNLLNKSATEINNLEDYIDLVSNTKVRKPGGHNIIPICGLYTGGLKNGEYVEKPLDNNILKELFGAMKIIKEMKIIREINKDEDSIEFSFIGSSDIGFYYSEKGGPVQGGGLPLTEKGNGWEWKEEYAGDTYYTENITGKWFYYEWTY